MAQKLNSINSKPFFSKREKIIVTAVILSLGLFGTQFVPFYLRYHYIAGLTVLAYLLSVWSLWEGLSKLKAIILLILPTFLTLSVSGYYFLLLSTWSRILAALIFGLSFYTLLLSQNIFNISAIRTIPLYRVSSTVIFVLTIVTTSLLFNVVYSLDLLFLWNGLMVFLLSFPLTLQVLWTIDMAGVSGRLLMYSAIISLIIGEVGLALSFWPISKAMISLVLTATLYITLGISLEALKDRLNREVVVGFLKWAIPIFLIAYITTSWAG
ncbi:hypothetical protein M1563_02820 [Patescibacteria group bacterium]|nr:hypothetical protein [Patescibacteria group bacterium]MCL5409912.1 hypothetical protein [Patescibacteria group bacterium]